ncbi:MAG: hypothetical protein J6M14_02765 [Campylobacter sp.]|nr:hypothetical protein [Campylobacter sp.]
MRLGRTYHHYNKNEDTPWHVGGVNYYPNTFPLRQKAIEYRQYLRDERGFTREQMGHD